MKEIFLLLGAFLVVAVNAAGNGHVAYYPVEGRGGRGGSTCMIKSRSIEVDEEDQYGKQASINPGSIFIPNLMNDDSGESSEDDEDPSSDEEYEDSGYDESGPAYPQQLPIQYAGGGGGYGPWPQSSPGETAVSVSSAPNFGPQFYSGGDQEKIKYKRKRGGSGGGKKGRGNINCIIITKGGKHHTHHKKKPSKLFGIFPIGGNRRSIARGLRSLKN